MTTTSATADKRRLLLDKLLRKQGLAPAAEPRIPRRSGQGPAPLSFAQQRLWILDRLEPASNQYNIGAALRLEGSLAIPVLAGSLAEIMRRHEVLRSTFPAVDGAPEQRVGSPAAAPVSVVDLSALPGERRKVELQAQAPAALRNPFDLACGPVFRAVLFRLLDAHHVLALVVHHIAADAWSVGIFVRELSILYPAFLDGRPSPLPELPVQYADFAVWQRTRLTDADVGRLLEGWRIRLAGLPPALELPTDRPRPPVQSFRGHSVPLRLDTATVAALRQLARSAGCTLFMALLAAFQALLFRHSGQRDLAVGSPVSGRVAEELEGVIGAFINTLVLRGAVDGEASFRSLITQAGQTVLGAHALAELPFEMLVDELQPVRSLARSPLFQVMLVVQSGGLEPLQLSGLALTPMAFDSGTAKFDLLLSLGDSGQEVAGSLEYSSDLFDRPTALRLLDHLANLLAGAAIRPDVQIADLPLLSEPEQQQLREWNDAAVTASGSSALHDLFAAQARRTPAAPAVTWGRRTLTYREIDEMSARIAIHLRALGVGPEVRVGVCLPRTPELVAALLGTLRAGGAYVPLDPAYPSERLAFLLADSRVRVLLTQPEVVTRAGLALDEGGPEIVFVAPDGTGLPPWSGVTPPAGTVPGNLAYVIYTSGSTGRPKGVAIEHRSAVALMAWARESFSDDELAGMLAATSICFDLSVFEIFTPLSWGGRIVLVDDALQLATLSSEADVRLVNTVPSAMAELVRLGGVPATVHTVALAGEPLKKVLVEQIAGRTSARRILNLYGPSEDTTYSTWGPQEADDSRPPTIGRPVADTRAHLLDAFGTPVPLGATGELYIGGEGLARGYLGRPELTAERFVPDPFGPAPGARLYRTGDLVRRLADGRLDFLGRADHQVKLRGFRIELGEIEAALEADPRIHEVVVVVGDREAAEDPGRLVAYVAGPEPRPTTAELRGALASRLPAYMVPHLFVFLSALPRTPNGKIDRAALPAPAGPMDLCGYVPPRSEVEALLAALWGERLRIDQIGIHDDFFALGGDSILSLQVIARAAKAGLHLTPKQFFERPTIAGLAEVARWESGDRAVEGPVTGPVPLTPIQLWFFAQELERPAHFNQAMLLRPTAPVVPGLLFAGFGELLRQHDALRTRFRPPATPGGSWTAEVVPPDETMAGSLVDLAALSPEARAQARAVAVAALQASLDLEAGPLVRAVLFHSGALDDRRLLVIIHHLVVDGVSWRILLEDQENLCRETPGGATGLPLRGVSYRSWAEALAGRAAASAGEEPEWLARLAGPLTSLPADLMRDEDTVGTAGSITVELDADATRALLHEVPRAYRTRINEVLLAALAEALAEWTGNRRVLVDVETHGRDEGLEGFDLSRTVGWFTAIVPVVLDLAGLSSPGDILKAVKEQLRGLQNGGLAYGLLRYLGTAETRQRLAARPRAEVVFNYLGRLDSALPAGALFVPAPEGAGAWRDARQRRAHALEINGGVLGGRLSLVWTFPALRFRRATVERVAGSFIAALRRAMTHCLQTGSGGWTPSDVTLARIDQATLDRLTASGGVEDLFPLSPLQEGMLSHTLRAPGSGVYVEQIQLVLQGDLDGIAFVAAWRDLAGRHAILRTSFAWDDLIRPLQIVHRESPLPVARIDLRGRSVEEQRREIAELLAADRLRGFDLASPPQRLTLLQLDEERYRLVWSFHHLILDGWSLPLLFRDLFALYEARVSATAADLEPARSYRDYIAWLEGRDPAAAEEFWRRHLAGFTAPTPLAVDHAPNEGTGESLQAELRIHLTAAATEALQIFARRHRLTLNTLVLGAWALLLRRYSGEEDLIFGVVTSGRSIPLPGVEGIAGLFINTLPLRLAAPAGAILAGWLREVQIRQSEVIQFEHSSLAEVQGWSDVRGRSLFDSILAFENYPVEETVRGRRGGRLAVEEAEALEQTSYPLAAAVGPGARLQVRLLFDPRRLDRVDVTRMAGHLTRLFESLPDNPAQALASVPLLSEAERHQIREWNDTAGWSAPGVCLHDLFTAAAARWPQHTAVIAADGEMTYRDLDRRSALLAGYLQRRGVGSGTPVGICAERSLDLVVGVYGILRAGGAYIPLDPSYPAERLAAMLDGVPLLLSQTHLAAGVGPTGVEAVLIDGDWAAIAAGPPVAEGPATTAQSLAYTIYTSGSTGRPKGVMIDHQGAVNTLLDLNRRFSVGPDDRILALSSLSFDLSVYDIFGLLATGGAVVLPPPAARRDPGAWIELASFHRVTIWNSVPALAEMMVDHLTERGLPPPPALRLILMSGDWIPVSLPDRLRALGRVEVIGMGGATEASIWSILYPIREVNPAWGSIPYGRPMVNQSFWVMSSAFEPQPVRVPGLLFIGGIGVALGYRNDEEKTRASFLRHPISGERLYRTGDLGRYLPDGNIEFLGRADHQIKIRGFRIELGEIEAVLAQHPEVVEAVAVVREDRPGDRQIAVWVVPAGPGQPPSGDLRNLLASRLPEYMLPSSIAFLDRLPLTTNGKVDRQALQQLPLLVDGSVQEASPPAPRSAVEELVTGIFCEVLRVSEVGIEDSFFDLGGHSLLATQVASRVRGAFGFDLPLEAIFEAPTVAGLACEIEEILRGGSRPALPPISPIARTEPLPMSFAQERLWFLDRLEIGSAAYDIAVGVELGGALDVAVLSGCFTMMARRQEVLRTRFATTLDGGAVPLIAEPVDISLPLIDLSTLSATLRATVVRRLAGELRRPFDLLAGPLWRAVLLRLTEREHALLLVLHHIIADGWSLGVMVREIDALYRSLRAGRTPDLPDLPVQYVDYAAWQRRWLSADVLEEGLAAWRHRLAGLQPFLELPTDRPWPTVRTASGAQRPLAWSGEQATGLRRLAHAQGVTLFMLLLAAFQSLLSRLSGREDLAVGSPVAGRDRTETEGLIGLFINTLVLRSDLTGDPAFGALLGRVRRVTLDSYRHQHVPFDKLVEELAPERNLAHTPLFQVLFVFDNAPLAGQRFELPELTMTPLRLEGKTAKLALTLWVAESPGGLTGWLEYSTDLFDAPTIDRWGRSLTALLHGAVADPECRLSALPVLSEEERQQIVREWSGGLAGAYSPETCLHELFAEQARRTPDAVALVAEDGALTYRELDSRANRVARGLRAAGTGPDVPVAFCAERSSEMMVGILGILKAGGAYVPLDPGYPAERLVLMLRDAGARLLLTTRALAPNLPPGDGLWRILTLDSFPPDGERPEDFRGISAASADSLAYVIYTSGSTGRPKGVMVSHRAIVNRVLWMKQAFPLSPNDAVLQKTPFIFDASIWELFLPLFCGARLVMATPGAHQDPAALTQAVAAHGVTVLQLVPSLVGAFLDDPGIAGCAGLRLLFCGGEALSPALRDRAFEALGAELCNLYGPTECAIDATAWLCPRGDRRPVIPIGRPLTNVRVHLLDASGVPVPAGVPGELHVGGLGLARGYLGQPGLTAERFVPDPFAQGAGGGRLYRTGDLARHLPDGSLEYLRRIDQQVKVRGFRVEPAEIEVTLAAHPDVRDAVVMVTAREDGGGRLVAWITSREGIPDTAALRRFLTERLPAHLIPSVFVTLPELPRAPSGKVDRKALPAPEAAGHPRRGGEPRNTVERLLALIWAEVLGVGDVGIHDNFFELGGDSILSLQVVSRAARAGCRITPRQIFEHQTIAGLAAVAGAPPMVGVEERAATGPLPLTPILAWFLALDDVDLHHFNQSILLRVRSGVDPETVRTSFARLLSHHDALRLRITAAADGWRARIDPGDGEVPWLHVDLTSLTAAAAATAGASCVAWAQGSLDLSRGPLQRALWLALPDGEARLLLATHHLVVDGVSWRILLEDLEAACRGGELPPRTTSFRHWAIELAAHAASMPLEPELSWWRGELLAASTEIPLDEPQGVDDEATSRWTSVVLEKDETRDLLQGAPAAYRTRIDDILLAALALTFVEGAGAVLVDLEGHGREEIVPGVDLSRTVGWLTALYPVRLVVEAGAGPGEVLRAVKEHLRALPGRGIGYGLLRWLRAGEPSLAPLQAIPPPSIAFNYLGQLDQGLPPSSLFSAAPEPASPARSPRRRRTHPLLVNGWIAGGRLRLDWGYSEGRHRRATVESFAQRYLSSLRTLIRHCLEAVVSGAFSWTPSDFPLAALDSRGLEEALGSDRHVEDLYPLSPLQEGILFHSLLAPQSEVYVEQLLCRFAGDLDAAAFTAAWQRLFARHPVLRTSFRWQRLDRPLQVVHEQAEEAGIVEDWRGFPAEERSLRLERLIRTDGEQGFDPARPPLARWALVRSGEGEHWFLWTHHHILLDGWSFSLLMGEFLICYAALRNGGEPVLPYRAPFRDHIAWLEQRDASGSEDYWQRTLAGFTAPTPLSVDRPALLESHTEWASRAVRLTPAQTAALQAAARHNQITLNTVAQAAWGVLLGRYGALDDVVFGATLSGRPAGVEGVESMLGLFINTLPVRMDLAGDPEISPWLREQQLRQAELLQHEHTPLIRAQGSSEVPRGVPLFESLLVFENYPVDQSLRSGDRSLEIAEVRILERTNYPLTLAIAPGEEMVVRADTLRSRFDEATVSRLLGHLATLLTALGEDRPEARLSDLPILSLAERHQLTVEWQAARDAAAPEACLHEIFAARAALSPSKVAVVYGDDEAFTYEELERRSNQLASFLQGLGVRPDVRVGICLERSLDMIVGILGILKAGGAYVPLDPADPAERLLYVFTDALEGMEPHLLVTRRELLAQLGSAAQALSGLRPVCLDTDADAIAAADGVPRPTMVLPDNLAYVIYTSGSTGRPKGVPITHRNVVRLFAAARSEFGYGEDDVWTLFHSYAFDFSVWELWGALLEGGRSVVVPYWVSRSPEELYRLLGRERVTVLSQTPSAFRQLAEAEERLSPAEREDLALRLVIFGGEALDPVTLAAWFDRHGEERPRLINMYGITETTVHVTLRSLTAADARAERRSPIGRPLSDLWTCLLGRDQRPVPLGVPGEVHVGGPGLSRGYLGRPALTAERFVPAPFSARPGARLYKTGDLARWSPSGELEFLGRIDHQVKIRGFRIELGEIESALRSSTGVEEAVVGVYATPSGPELHAWVEAPVAAGLTAGALRNDLAAKLPSHMLPAAFSFLERFPLTPNGKIDRRALPAPERGRPAERELVPPRTSTEEGVVAIWREVLGLERVSVEDDFFALGGHSLVATRVVSRIAATFFVDLPLSDIFAHPTVEGLAARIDEATLAVMGEGDLDDLLDLVDLVPVDEGKILGDAAPQGPQPVTTDSEEIVP